ncbi:MAG: formate dehydrogenase accessory sulfurtransferase FdhD [Desulfuromonadales bacterium]|nr:formate dehydrogenase accessory sulfurtransferase FdhD [Desulfuromonadales bacterium]MDW7758735.1 formate dehydrogenase accessory sulfurtransferase FdhD [Desulfuromonadales bacterium]
MEQNNQGKIVRVDKTGATLSERAVVREFPLRLTVNGRELATLIASPHQLNYLVAGFFRLQGMVATLDDILSLGICSDFGAARVQLRQDIPLDLRPVLTSGCGTGITFDFPAEGVKSSFSDDGDTPTFTPESVFSLMRELQRHAEGYRRHGGMHSAAVGDGQKMLLYAEDIGRHNTLDRIAGEALFKGVDLSGKLLVTSGRVSTEMVAKAARLGIAAIASRTSPTDMAVRLSEQAGICLIGYVRAETMEIFSHAERLRLPDAKPRLAGVTGVILAGGESRRMGSDKSLLPIDGARFIDHIYRRLSLLFDEVIIVTNSPDLYADIPCRKVPDLYRAQGSLAGIHSGLHHARHERIFVVACDMPFVSPAVIRRLCLAEKTGDVVIPWGDQGFEPLHAVYGKGCLPVMERTLVRGDRRIVSFFDEVKVVRMPLEDLAELDPQGLSFRNINTPQEYFHLREKQVPGNTAEQTDTLGARLGQKG